MALSTAAVKPVVAIKLMKKNFPIDMANMRLSVATELAPSLLLGNPLKVGI